MILLAAVLASVAIAWLRGGRFTELLRMPLRWGGLAVVVFAVQALFLYQTPSRKVVGEWGWQELLFTGSHVLLLLTVWANRHLVGVPWIGLGLLLNLVVMVANGGWMPITPNALVGVGLTNLVPSLASGTRVYSSKNIILSREATKLWFLSDVFALPRPFPVPSVFSIGDVLVAVGVFLLIQKAMVRQEAWARSPSLSERSRG
jgi:hypothetical protein